MSTFAKLSTFLALLVLSGCATESSYIHLKVRTKPGNDLAGDRPRVVNYDTWKWASEPDPSGATRVLTFWFPGEDPSIWKQKITREDIAAGIMKTPKLVVVASGYKKYFLEPVNLSLTGESLLMAKRGGVILTAKTDLVELERDPDFEVKNWLEIIVNSEPHGARIYENGKFIGTTPFKLKRQIAMHHYETKIFKFPPMIAVYNGWLPERQDIELAIDPEWTSQTSQTHEYATLFLLKRDPNYKPSPVVIQQPTQMDEQTVIIKKEKDELDILQQLGQIGIIIKALQPLK